MIWQLYCFLVVFCGQLTSLVAQTVKKLPAMQETQVRSLGQEGPLDSEMGVNNSKGSSQDLRFRFGTWCH